MSLPLHVQVAQALGWTDAREHDERGHKRVMNRPGSSCGWAVGRWYGFPPEPGPMPLHTLIPLYDTDWSATGPLIEKYRLEINFSDPFKPERNPPTNWHVGWHLAVVCAEDKSLLVALCKLILALKEAGRL